MADLHRAKDGPYRRSYTHDRRSFTRDHGYQPDDLNTGKLYAWQHAYWTLHGELWRDRWRVLKH